MIRVGTKVTEAGGGAHTETGIVREISGRRARIEWAQCGTLWTTIHMIQPATESSPAHARPTGVHCDECGRFIPGATTNPAYCSNC